MAHPSLAPTCSYKNRTAEAPPFLSAHSPDFLWLQTSHLGKTVLLSYRFSHKRLFHSLHPQKKRIDVLFYIVYEYLAYESFQLFVPESRLRHLVKRSAGTPVCVDCVPQGLTGNPFIDVDDTR